LNYARKISQIRPTDKEELNGEWAPVGPPITAITETLDGCIGQQLADNNTQVDTCRGDATKDNGRDLFKHVSELISPLI
jgi:hypothetical protein